MPDVRRLEEYQSGDRAVFHQDVTEFHGTLRVVAENAVKCGLWSIRGNVDRDNGVVELVFDDFDCVLPVSNE